MSAGKRSAERVTTHEKLLRKADVRVTPERRQDGRQTALGPRAERTRQRLIDSAWKLFCEKGYVATSVSDIADDAGVSLATFYQYFSERNDIVAVIVVDIIKEMLDSGVDRWDPRSGRMGLRRVIQPYVEGYARHADFFELWQCVTHVDQRMRSLYRYYHGSYHQRFAGYLREGMELGLVRSDLDPIGMATSMMLMLERYCYEVFVMDPSDPPADQTAVTDLLTSLWADAVKLEESHSRPRVQNGVGPKTSTTTSAKVSAKVSTKQPAAKSAKVSAKQSAKQPATRATRRVVRSARPRSSARQPFLRGAPRFC